MLLNFILYLFIGLSQAQVVNFCHVNKTDFCLGASIFSNSMDLNWREVQVKSRVNNQESDTTFRINWQSRNGSYYFASNKSTAVGSDQGFAYLRRGEEGFLFEKGNIFLKSSRFYCLSILKCDRGVGGFCNPRSIYKAESVEDIKKGSYTAFKLCREDDISQQFAIDPPCARYCTAEMLNNDVCDQSCNYRTCFYDMGNCNSTYSPTRNPTTAFPTRRITSMPTKKGNNTSLKPSVRPTTHPTLNPTKHPTLFPSQSPTQPTAEPTFSPSVEPTVAPTPVPTYVFTDYEYGIQPYESYFTPTIESDSPTPMPTLTPTSMPTNNPTQNPQQNPTLNPTHGPTQNPTMVPSNQPSGSPTVRPIKRPTRSSAPTLFENSLAPSKSPVTLSPTDFVPLTSSPTSVNNSNLQTYSPTSPGLTSGEQAGLSIGLILLCFLLIYCCWFAVRRHQEKETNIKQVFLTWKAKQAPHSANMPDEDSPPPRRDSSPRMPPESPTIASPRAQIDQMDDDVRSDTPVYHHDIPVNPTENLSDVHINIPQEANN